MSERISNKKQNFDGIDPQESLIKSLESIKSLLKQGDSKIHQARENIARADNLNKDEIKSRLSKQSPEIPNTAFISSASIQKPTILEKSAEAEQDFSNIPELNQELNEINDDEIPSLEEIFVDAIPEDNIFNSNTKTHQTEISSPETSSIDSANTALQQKNTPLNEMYDHNLIVPMLDEIIIPEDQNSSMFNMDSSVEIKLDSKLASKFVELSSTDDNSSDKIETDITIKDEAIKSAYNSIKKAELKKNEDKPNADIISFELSSNAIKNNLKKSDKKTIKSEKAELKTPNKNIGISLVEDSKIKLDTKAVTTPLENSGIDQVIIKETTNTKIQIENIPAKTEKNKLTAITSKKQDKALDIDLTPAIDTTNYTDDVLTTISASNSEIIKPNHIENSTTSKTQNNSNDEIDFSKIEGLDRLEFNANKMEALQKRVEKRVHNRLIQLIVQLDDEIKTIFSDEIKNCIAHELKNAKDKNENKK